MKRINDSELESAVYAMFDVIDKIAVYELNKLKPCLCKDCKKIVRQQIKDIKSEGE